LDELEGDDEEEEEDMLDPVELSFLTNDDLI
jgi:hypothetical protein